MDSTRFSTALRDDARKRIEKIGHADIVVGIPSYFSDSSIAKVIDVVARGLDEYYPDKRSLIYVSEGGSTDDTREVAESVRVDSFNIEKIVSIYRGIPGKGSGLRAVFEAAEFLRADGVAVLDSDLESIKPEWIRNLLDPIFQGYDYVAPRYLRFKYDATISNTIAYNMTRSLYGYRIRQPIGGDFGMSPRIIRDFLDDEVWETDVARFGIDIWMTTKAVVEGYKVCEARLGTKIHAVKDPASDLSPMYRQVVGTIFTLMEQYEANWKKIKGSKEVPLFGEYADQPIPTFEIDREGLVDYFRLGLNNFSGVWANVIEEGDMEVLRNLNAKEDAKDFHLPPETWVRIVHSYARAFHETPRQRMKLIDTMIPLYNARVASLANELQDMDPLEAEEYFEKQAGLFEDMKDHLVLSWDGK